MTGAADSNTSARGRLPAMQFVRTGTVGVHDRQAAAAAIDKSSASGLDTGPNNDGGSSNGRTGWMVAVASPMSVLQGFALAVIGMETRVAGASVRVVDRSTVTAPAAEREAAMGFVGFEEVHAG